MERYPMSMHWKNIVKISISLNVIYRINPIHVNLQTFFIEIEKKDFKIHMEMQNTLDKRILN